MYGLTAVFCPVSGDRIYIWIFENLVGESIVIFTGKILKTGLNVGRPDFVSKTLVFFFSSLLITFVPLLSKLVNSTEHYKNVL